MSALAMATTAVRTAVVAPITTMAVGTTVVAPATTVVPTTMVAQATRLVSMPRQPRPLSLQVQATTTAAASAVLEMVSQVQEKQFVQFLSLPRQLWSRALSLSHLLVLLRAIVLGPRRQEQCRLSLTTMALIAATLPDTHQADSLHKFRALLSRLDRPNPPGR